MMSCKQQPPVSYAVAELEAVLPKAGLTQDDLTRLFASGLGVNDLLDYVEKVAADRLS